VGKSQVACGIGHALIDAGFRVPCMRTSELVQRLEPIAERYGRRSILITANQPFSGWNNVCPGPGMTVAAIDRLGHHSTNFEHNKTRLPG